MEHLGDLSDAKLKRIQEGLDLDYRELSKTYERNRKNKASERNLQAIRKELDVIAEHLYDVDLEMTRRAGERKRQNATEEDEFDVLQGGMDSRRMSAAPRRTKRVR